MNMADKAMYSLPYTADKAMHALPDAIGEVMHCLPDPVQKVLLQRCNTATEVRLRAGQKARVCFADGDAAAGEILSQDKVFAILLRMLEHSLYAWEEELKNGFFTLPGGARVGVCGRFSAEGGKVRSVSDVQSLCVRIPREVPGLGRALAEKMRAEKPVLSAVILSPPGLGKTTLLRDTVRILSDNGSNAGLCDERGEIAAVRSGKALLQVGERTDVISLCPKHIAILRFVRTMCPDVVAADEMGDPADIEAVAEARRCGVSVLATAHARSLEEAMERPVLGPILRSGVFDLACVLSGAPGRVESISDIRKA